MTERELAIIAAFAKVTFLPGSSEKRFARAMTNFMRETPAGALSAKQSQYLEIMAWLFRRQMPADLVPPRKPEHVA